MVSCCLISFVIDNNKGEFLTAITSIFFWENIFATTHNPKKGWF